MNDDLPRVAKQTTAAEMLRITPRRLREMESAPWWQPEFRTEDGYAVCDIVRAQYEHSGGTDDADLKARREVAETERAEYERDQHELKAWELARQKAERLRNILPASVYQRFLRELLGMIRQRLTDLPYRLSKSATPAQRKLIYVPEKKIKRPNDAAPLQREITKLLDEIQRWLDGTDDD